MALDNKPCNSVSGELLRFKNLTILASQVMLYSSQAYCHSTKSKINKFGKSQCSDIRVSDTSQYFFDLHFKKAKVHWIEKEEAIQNNGSRKLRNDN